MKRLTSFSLVLVMAFAFFTERYAMADNVDGNKARQVAAYYLSAQFGNKAITPQSLELVYQIDNTLLNIPALYCFNTADKRGFVIVSGSDSYTPVISYSTDGSLDPDNIPPAMLWFLNEQVQNIAYAQNEQLPAPAEIRSAWAQLEEEALPYFGTPTKAVTRLLKSTWNQEPLYNRLCPTGNQGLAVTGCVATAMAQLIYYWRYPRQGKGMNGYEVGTNYDASIGYLEVNFAEQYYNYDLMVDALSSSSTDEQINEVAKLNYHCGVSVNMGYSATASGTQSAYVPMAFRMYFKYDRDSMSYSMVDRSITNNTYTNPTAIDSAWVNMLKKEIAAKRPVYYSGYDPNGGVHAGHAFICDGYNSISDMLHFNWGWGGSGDSWCNVYKAQLKPSTGGYNFTSQHQVILGLQPPADSIKVGIQDVDVDPFTASIFPNPAHDQITISYQLNDVQQADMQVFDLTGRLVETVALTPASSQVTLSVANYQPGVYVCRLQGHAQKFIVR